jgi:hypothetical protein
VGKLLTLRSAVIAYLHSPREKIWGILLSINSYGIILRGIDINSFEDWSRSVVNSSGSESIGLNTMFIPMMRLEKVIADETTGNLKSFSEKFQDRVGRDVLEFANIPEDEDSRFDF